jgi:hypothetical protein
MVRRAVMAKNRRGQRRSEKGGRWAERKTIPPLPPGRCERSAQEMYNVAMIDPAQRLGPPSRTLKLWASLYRQAAFRAPLYLAPGRRRMACVGMFLETSKKKSRTCNESPETYTNN